MLLSVQIRKKLHNGRMLDVHFDSNDSIAILGGSDSGKSLLLSCIAGTARPDEGRISFGDKLLYDSLRHVRMCARQRKIVLIEQDQLKARRSLRMTVNEYVNHAVRDAQPDRKEHFFLAKHSRKEVSLAAQSLLKEFDLDGLGAMRLADLTLSLRIRVDICRAAAQEPVLLLLDDPFAGLESYEKARLLTDIRDQLKKKGIPFVFASRNRDEVFAMCEQVLALHEYKSSPLARREEFFSHPRTISAALLAGFCNVTNIRFLNATHVAANEWKMIFFRHEKSSAFDASARKDPEDGTGKMDAGERDASTLTPDAVLEKARKNEERRMQRRLELREDLERSLRFELVEADDDKLDNETGHKKADNTPGTGGKSADKQLPLMNGRRWQILPAEYAAIGFRPDAFQINKPQKEHFYTFRLHDKRVEKDLDGWRVYFTPYVNDADTSAAASVQHAFPHTSTILWQIPAAMVSRRVLDTIDVLYLPEKDLLFLEKG